MSEHKLFCLTLDLENDWYFDEPGYDHLTLEYLDEFIELMQELELPLSVFVVGDTLERFPDEVDQLDAALDCEFHLHSYQHDTTKSYEFREEVRRGVAVFEDHFGDQPVGYRAPQGNIEPNEFMILDDEGFAFDSSVFPSFRPGVYNNLNAPIEPFWPDGGESLLEIPLGVVRGIRIPTALSYVKAIGQPMLSLFRVAPMPSVVVFNIHLQDLYRTDSHAQLQQPKKTFMLRNMERSAELFESAVNTLIARGYDPRHITDVVDQNLRANQVDFQSRKTAS